MPREDGKRSSIGKLLTQGRDLSPTEQASLAKIGDLIDATVNSRRVMNVGAQKRRLFQKALKELPKPSNIRARAVSNGVRLEWNPVDVEFLIFYEVVYSEGGVDPAFAVNNKTVQTGSTSVLLRDLTGQLQASVRTVDRNGDVSEWAHFDSSDLPATAFHLESSNNQTVFPAFIELNTPPDRKLLFYLGISFDLVPLATVTPTITVTYGDTYAGSSAPVFTQQVDQYSFSGFHSTFDKTYSTTRRTYSFFTPTYDGRTKWWVDISPDTYVTSIDISAILA